ncbi:GlsB/YeaQ/YmgE family stress response membrane protein [Jannaschia marina]|uniref:GlsB/YeaQ/YmgE family stress response membrane protein n=1 Tax=Jannaschia marina TaxID=2741674 RepID=UPI0015CD5ED5|nr:GlsB/YeaQ/YmgE family stress response membrane protein [Jannaschia marina]
MEEVAQGIGVAALVVRALAGAGIGALIGKLSGRRASVYAAIGLVAAIATPFLLMALGVTVLAAGGLFLVALVGVVGAAVVVALVRALSRV